MDFAEAIAQFAAYELMARGRARLTVEAYRRDLSQFAQLAGVEDLAAFDKAAVLRWLAAVAALELAPRSRARKLSTLRSFSTWAVEYGHLPASPVPEEIRPPRALYLPHTLSEQEVIAIIDAAAPAPGNLDPETQRDHAMLETLYASGMRVSELCALELSGLHLAEGFAMVTGKGSKQRLVPLGQYALDSLRRYLEDGRGALCPRAHSCDEVFLTRRGPISRSQVFRLVKKYAALAGVKSAVSPHTFRHSCASHLLAHGADLRLVQELLGHASLATTEVYTHIERTRMREVYDACHPLA